MKRIYLIDCPGVVPPNMNDTEEDILLRGVVRVENVSNPEQYVAAALRKCKPKHVQRTYEVPEFKNHMEFLEMLARKGGRLLKGGEADVDGVAKMVLNDFLRGKIPWFTAPPSSGTAAGDATKEGAAAVVGDRTGDVARLNKIPTAELRAVKRKRADEDVGAEDEDEAEEVEDDDDDDVEDVEVGSSEDVDGIDPEELAQLQGEALTSAQLPISRSAAADEDQAGEGEDDFESFSDSDSDHATLVAEEVDGEDEVITKAKVLLERVD